MVDHFLEFIQSYWPYAAAAASVIVAVAAYLKMIQEMENLRLERQKLMLEIELMKRELDREPPKDAKIQLLTIKEVEQILREKPVEPHRIAPDPTWRSKQQPATPVIWDLACSSWKCRRRALSRIVPFALAAMSTVLSLHLIHNLGVLAPISFSQLVFGLVLMNWVMWSEPVRLCIKLEAARERQERLRPA
ncbi:hypothetical protein GCM10011487_46160 [Steroidobacter agaridevorans]|uniref:Uncharacterized protein n=1 Tax=Steroidobacter agaridevorans TaxID=2695856 RepID=A0A829YJC7_9GAMM|nr:hypothetical protein [Steroidobacter agaridevorans]GFE82616.1 hypothetical protein GCM10011487_46160 [Steroidobacter agaridevorans]GFE85068.1 hypothetical protein GCM10011488_00220 [Steroidobacter agaridevorans]